jgi:hypothetical protein
MNLGIIVLGFFAGQISEDESFNGRVEQVNKARGTISVLEGGLGTKRLFYLNEESQLTKDGEPCKLTSLKANDTVAITWTMKRMGQTERRVLKTLDIRPLLLPGKFKAGQVGYLPLQNDAYGYFCEYVDNERVLIREIVGVPTYRTVYASERGRRVPVGRELVKLDKKEGEPFFLSGVDTSKYAVGRNVVLDGKWKVETTATVAVTKAGDVITTKTTYAGTSQVQQNTKVKTAGQNQTQVTTDGSTTQRDVKGKSDTDRNTDQDTAGKSTGTATRQSERTKTVSGFVLVPFSPGAKK